MPALTQPPAARIRVKFLSKAIKPQNISTWINRFPGGMTRWGRCDFTFDTAARDYDWLVVYDDLPASAVGQRFTEWQEPLPHPGAQSLLITTEPSTIKVYGHKYAGQFDHVLTSQEPWALRHPRAIRSQCGLIWYYGGTGKTANSAQDRNSHDQIASFIPLEKSADISTVCSAKQQSHTLHHARYAFTQKLKAALPELDVFGHGVRYAENKADTLDPYRYHVAIENHLCPHHWTEKLADSFLGACLPFYHGCPNYADYFPAESVIPINIHDFPASLETITRAIRDREHEKRLPAILESRRLVLEKYSLFPLVSGLIEERHDRGLNQTPPRDTAQAKTIYSRHALRKSGLGQSVSFVLEKTAVSLRHRLGLGGAQA